MLKGEEMAVPESSNGHGLPSNWLLAALPELELERLRPHLRSTSLPVGQILHESGECIERVYFPDSGMVSLVLTSGDGTNVEVGIVGREGMVGTAALLQSNQTISQAIVQIAGCGWRLPAEVLRAEFKRGGLLQDQMLRYAQTLLMQTSQTALCNRLHTVEERLARWLLMAHDCVQSDTIGLTQEFIADMLGTRRTGVTIAAGVLRQEGLIDYTRGYIKITDHEGLKSAACECYPILHKQFAYR